METGLRQGNTLSPELFNIALKSIVRKILDEATGLSIGKGRIIKLAAYADDITVIRETEEGVIRLAEKLISKEKRLDYKLMIKK